MTSIVNVPRGGALEDDILKYTSPVYKGGMSYCYADPYYYHSLLDKYYMTEEQLEEAVRIVRERHG